MLNLPSNAKAAHGFSLIELMIATTIGLIVTGAAVALIVSVDQSNSETIQSTRLTQELRALAAVIADDMKRGRALDDPIGMVGQGTGTACVSTVPATTGVPTPQPCYVTWPKSTTAAPAHCATYGFTDYSTAAKYSTESRTYIYRKVRLNTVSGVGSVALSEFVTDPSTLKAGDSMPSFTDAQAENCNSKLPGSTETTLNSTQINVTDVTFTYVNAGEIDLSLTAKFKAGDSYTKNITRTFTQPIFIRSAKAQ